jgi:ketosteroid isomerase-like protein
MTELDVGDRLALAELPERYAALVDARDLDRLADLFSADAVLVTPDPPRSSAGAASTSAALPS